MHLWINTCPKAIHAYCNNYYEVIVLPDQRDQTTYCGFLRERQFPVWTCGIPANHLSWKWNSFGGHVKNRDQTAFKNSNCSVLCYQPTIPKLQGSKKLKKKECFSWNIWFSIALISQWKQIINVSINIKRIIQSSLSSLWNITVFWMQQQQTHFHRLKECSQNSPRTNCNSRKTWLKQFNTILSTAFSQHRR